MFFHTLGNFHSTKNSSLGINCEAMLFSGSSGNAVLFTRLSGIPWNSKRNFWLNGQGNLYKLCWYISLFSLISLKVAGLITFVAGVAIIHKEKTHAAISSVNIQTAPILLLVAGILSVLLAGLGIYCIMKKLTFNGSGKAFIIVVSSIKFYTVTQPPQHFSGFLTIIFSTVLMFLVYRARLVFLVNVGISSSFGW